MKIMLFTLLCVATGYAEGNFSERASNFSIELLHYTQLEKDGHVVISPFGIWTLMTGVALGTSSDSKKQLLRAFFLPHEEKDIINGYKKLTATILNTKSSDVKIENKNFMFLDEGFKIDSTFKNKMMNDFGAMVSFLNFKNLNSAARYANTIIQNSGASVSNVLRSDDFSESRMILTNAIMFKGLWKLSFNTTETILAPFYSEEGKEIGKVNMMYQRREFAFSNIHSIKSRVLELPYGKDDKYCMLILLPLRNARIVDVYKKFDTVSFKDIFDRLKSDVDNFGYEDIDIRLPRFKISTNIVLNRPLNNMGVFNIFDQILADFSKVSNDSMCVSAIVHKADIEVIESGTEASASTNAYIFDRRIRIPLFNANRPFLYFVMEKPTATVIFSGIYSKPSIS